MKKKSKMRIPASERALQVKAYILGYYTDRNYMPTQREIADYFGKTRQWADFCLGELERMGHIKIEKGKMRGIFLI